MYATMVDDTNNPNRLYIALLVATALHALLVFGVTFTAQVRDLNLSKTLEVTLAVYKSDEAPEKADFLAQENQIGSGTMDESRMLSSDMEAIFQTNTINETSLQEQDASAPRLHEIERQVVTSEDSEENIKTKLQEATMEVDIPDGPEKSLLERSLEMASLEAKLDSLRQVYAKQPRVQRLTAASTMKANDAYYVNSWRRRIEDNGKRNYPRQAENCRDDCRLRLLVAINADGTIKEIRIMESSGRQTLDDAAIRIVRNSAPFPPFTEEMKKTTDVLEIIRTWQFKGNRYLSEAG